MKVYFMSGEGIKNPVDCNGDEIKEGYILTHTWYDDVGDKFFQEHFPQMSKEGIEENKNRPVYIVKYNPEGFFYGEGIYQKGYLHDFRFKDTKIINQIPTDR